MHAGLFYAVLMQYYNRPVGIFAGAMYDKGSQFFMGFLKNYDTHGTNDLRLVVSTSSIIPIAFSISTLKTHLSSGTVSPQTPKLEIRIPLEYMVRTSSIAERREGIVITANSSEVSVVAVTINIITQAQATSAAYRIFPFQRLPVSQYEYFAVSIDTKFYYLLSEFLLVGNEDNTTITVFPSTEEISLPLDAQDGGNSTIMVQPGQGHTMTLHRLQTLLITKAGTDLTGTRIVSNKPLSVLSGHECGNVPRGLAKCDHVGVHVRPTATWGKEFLLVPFLGRPSGQRFKIVAARNDTLVDRTCSGSFTGTESLTHPGDSHVFHTSPYTSCYLRSNKPLMVVQLSQGNEADGRGDPSMVLVAPMEQYVNRVSFSVLDGHLFSNSYITITTTSTKHFNPADILLDGQPVKGDWSIIISKDVNIIGLGCKVAVSPGHHIVHDNNPKGKLSVMIYGLDNKRRHAYAYLGAVSRRIPPG